MTKFGLAVVTNKLNYGSLLQTFALVHVLDKMKIDCEVIDQSGLKKSISANRRRYYLRHLVDISLYKAKAGFAFMKLREKYDTAFGRKIGERRAAFSSFVARQLHFSKRFHDFGELNDHCKNYSAVMVGSDQLWLPVNLYGDFYTLSFVPDGVKRLSYATSFGVASITAAEEKIAASFLTRFQHISVREDSGRKLIMRLTGSEAAVVCDPVFLLSAQEWNDIFEKYTCPIQEPYIFCYFLGRHQFSREFAMTLQKKTGLRIVTLRHLDEYIAKDEAFGDIAPYDIGPFEFVRLIQQAAYMVTDSFHGTAFSILLHKDFYAFHRHMDNDPHSTNTRIDMLLSAVGLQNRLVERNAPSQQIHTVWSEINYQEVDERVAKLRRSSMDYLRQIVEECTDD